MKTGAWLVLALQSAVLSWPRRPRVARRFLRRMDVWATPLWTQLRLQWLRTLGLPCAAPRESCGLPTGRHGHAPVPQPPPAHAGQSSWRCYAVGHPLLGCVVEHALEPQNPTCPGRFLSAGRQDSRPPDTSVPPLPCPTTVPADLLSLFPAPPSTPPHRRRPARPSRRRSPADTVDARGAPRRRPPPKVPLPQPPPRIGLG
jgi:hypothetical protein